MLQDTLVVRAYFARLGLEPEIADIYLALHLYGRQTISQLSRNSKVERTRIYRLMDSLKSSNLVEVEVHYKREIFKAAPVTNLQILLTRKEEELRELQAELGRIHQTLNQNHLSSPLTHVQFYKGPEGNKQMYWNETRAKSEVLCILDENMQNRVGMSFFNRWVRKCNEEDIKFRGIVGDNFMPSQKKWYAKNRNERLAHWQQRSVPPTLFPVTHSTVTYDDVIAYYNWQKGEVFGIEIYNQEIATAQRHFFDMLWQQAATVQDVDVPRGTPVV